MTCYLLHFNQPIPRGVSPHTGKPLLCGHYLGSADDVETRLEQHRNGQGSRLMSVLAERGIDWVLARTWKGGRIEERQLKRRKNSPKLCPVCREARHVR